MGLAIGIVAAAIDVQPADARPVIFVRPSYGFGFYGPAWYGPAWGPAYVVPRRVTGDVKIDTHQKQDVVYVDGGFAGQTGNLKKFELRPGNHDIELRDNDGETIYQERVAVTIGETTKLRVS